MKAEFVEHEGCFEIHLVAESLPESVAVARFGMNKTKEIRSQSAYFSQNGTAGLSVVIGKKKEPHDSL